MDLAGKMVRDMGLCLVLEENGLTEEDVIRILLDKGLIDPKTKINNPMRIDYGDDEE